MVNAQKRFLKNNFKISKNIYSLGIPDRYGYMDSRLIKLIRSRIMALKLKGFRVQH